MGHESSASALAWKRCHTLACGDMTSLTQPPRSRARFQLTIVIGTARETVALDEGKAWIVGRSSECSIHVDDPSVSRRHAQLYPAEDRVEVEDLDSANGTWVVRTTSSNPATAGSEQRIAPHERARLRVGEALRVGDVRIVLGWLGGLDATHPRVSELPDAPVLVDPVMHGVYELVQKAARRDISVLILGETGVGKELIAQMLHRSSPRASGPFSILNCAALPEALLERELFGLEPEATLGAASSRAGLLEQSDGGTLFLDEIGELPLGIQPKLLRVLEERMMSRVGSQQPRSIDVRFVAATNRDLLAEVRAGQFRGDLYYRISGLSIRVPPLRERRSEIEPLARHFVRAFAAAAGEPAPELTRPAVAALERHSWPGNVRELRNVIERAVLIADGGVVDEAQILLDVSPPGGVDSESWDAPTRVDEMLDETQRRALEPLERERLLAALDACAGNQRRAAELLGISRRTLVNRLNKWKLPRPRKKEPPLGA
jgi:two-component system response regulator AtoC